jgi:hypothetical protein
MEPVRRRVSYANVMSTLAVFVALGGSSYAAAKVNGKNLKGRSVAGSKLKKDTVGGAEVKESKLGVVPRADRASVADRADQATGAAVAGNAAALGGVAPSGYLRSSALSPPPWQTLTLQNGWVRGLGGAGPVPAVYRDQLGIVHLKGAVQRSSGSGTTVATLPVAFRPLLLRSFAASCALGPATLQVQASGSVELIELAGADCDIGGSLDASFRPDG